MLILLALATTGCTSTESRRERECHAAWVHLLRLEHRADATEEGEAGELERRLRKREARIDDDDIDICLGWSKEKRRCLMAARYDHEVERCREL